MSSKNIYFFEVKIFSAIVSSFNGFDARNADMNNVRALLKRSFADQFRKHSKLNSYFPLEILDIYHAIAQAPKF